MAIYRVTDLAGNAVQLEGPEGLSDSQVIDAYLSAQEGAFQEDAFSPDELARLAAGDPTLLDQFTEGAAGVGAGAINMLGLGAKGAATLLPEDLELMVREGIITAEEAAQSLFAPELGREELVGRKFGEALGSFVPLAGLSLAGPLGMGAAAGLATGAGAGEASERARAAGATEEERTQAALLGSFVGASELLPIKFLKALNKSGFDELIQRITRVAQSAGVEGAQEAAAQIGQNLIAQGVYDPEQGAFTGTGESLGYGAGVGGFVQAVMDLALPRVRGGSTYTPPVDEVAAPAETPSQMELFDDEQGGMQGQMDLFPEIPAEVLAELEAQSPEFAGEQQLDLFEEPSPQVDIEELIADRERADFNAEFAAQQEGLPLLLGYEPTRTVEGPKGKPIDLPSPVVEAARIRQQEAEQQAALEAEQARAIDEAVLASQGQDFELTPQEQFLIEMSLDNPDLTQDQLTRVATELAMRDSQPDMFPLEQLLAQPREVPVEAPVAQEEQLELPGIEPAMLQGEMFGPRGGIRRDRQDLAARPVQEEVAPEPATAVQPELAGIEPVEKQGEMFGPRGGIPRKPKAQAPAPAAPALPKMVVNKELLKALGVAPNAAVAKRLTAKEYDLNVEQDRAFVAKELVAYARQPAIPAPTKNKINNFVNNIDPAQRDMFSRAERSAPKKKVVAEAPKKAPTITPEAKADIKQKLEARETVAPEVKPVPTQGETQNVQPVDTKPAPTRSGPKGDSGSRSVKKPQGTETKPATTGAATPDGTRLEPAVNDTRPTGRGEVAGGSSLGNKRTGKANRQALPKEDGDKITQVVTRKPKNAKKEGVSEAVSAKRYFEKYDNTGDALYRVAYDATVGLSDKEASVTTDPVVKKLLTGTSTEVAQKTIQWVRKNLSKDANAQLDKYIAEVEKDNSRNIEAEVKARDDATKNQRKIDKALAKSNQNEGEKQWAVADRLERLQKRKAEKANARLADDAISILDEDVSFEGGVDDLGTLLNLIEDGVDSLVVRSHPIVTTLLKTGQLKSALNAIAATTSDPNVTRIADKLAANIGDTKIKIVPADSMEAIGTYSPKTNTITIREDAIDSTHALMHEAAHAVTQATLRNKSHPLTKQLQKIFNDVSPRLVESKQYGSLSLDEFVAEYFGNDSFRAELATTFPRNSDKSLLTKMTDAIVNFLKKMLGLTSTRGMTVEQLDELMMSVVAPSIETRKAADLLYNPKLAADAVSETYKKAAGLADSAVDKVISKSKTAESVWDDSVEAKKTIVQMTKDGVLGALPLASLVNIAKKYLPKLAEEFNTKFNLYKGEIDKSISTIGNGVVKDFNDWNKANADKYPAMKKVLLEGSLAEIDFRKPRTDYKGDKLAAYDKLLPLWESLGSDGQRQYKAVRATYDRLYKDLVSAFRSDVENTTGDKVLATKLHNEFYNRLVNKGGLEGYFPLRRQGKYLLSFSFLDEDGNSRDAFEMFDSSRERDERKALLENSGILVPNTLKTPLQLKASAFEGSDPSTFVGSVIEILKANKADTKTVEQVMRLAVELSPQNSLARMLTKRSGVAGFNDDVNEVFKDTSVGLAKRIASLKFRSNLNKLQDDIDAYVRDNAEQDTPDGRRIKFYGDELQRRLELAKDPNMPAWSNLIKSTTYLYTLGFNASSALIDMAAIPMVLYPQLKGSYPKADVWKIIGNAMNDYMKSGRTHYVESYLTEGLSGKELQDALDAAGLTDRDIKARKEIQSIVNYDFRDKNLPANIKELKELVDLMLERGQVQRVSFFDDLEAIGENKFMSKFNTYQGAMMQVSERARREVTMVAKYRLEIDKMRQEGRTIDKAARAEAAEAALTLSQLTNGSTSMLEGSRFGQNPIGSIAFMYKNYGARMMALQFDMFNRMTKGETAEIRAEARKQLGITLGMAAIFSGVRGMPMVGVVALLYNMYKDDEDDDFDTMLYKNLGTLGAKGMVDSLTGMSVSQRIALTDMIYRSDGMGEEQSPAETFWTTLGGPAAGTIDKLDRAGNAFAKGNWERGVEGMMPAAIANLMKAARFNFEGARTLKGDVITDDIGPLSIFGQALGFAPTDYVQRQRFITMQKLGEASVTEKRSLLFDKAYIAKRNGDAQAYREVLKEIEEFNKSLKDKKKQILPENLERSAKTRKGIDQKRIFGVTAQNPERWRREAAELGLEI